MNAREMISPTARKQFVEAVRAVIDDLDQGRGATACMDDIKRAYRALKNRTTRKGKEARE